MGWRERVQTVAEYMGHRPGGGRGAVSERAGDTADWEGGLWRAISPPVARGGFAPGGNDYDPADWQRLAREAYLAYCTNPLAYAVIEQQTNFVLGGGARVVASDARVQRVVDGFWQDPDNAMDRRIYSIQTELALFGEQFIRYFVDGVTGRTVIRQLDPLDVVGIETDPDDMERVLGYHYRLARSNAVWATDGGVGTGAASMGHTPGTLSAPVAVGDGGYPGRTWLPGRDVSHFAINRVSNALRGRSDLAPVLRWMRCYTEWLTERATQNRLKGAVLYDVTVQGGSRQDVERLRAAHAQAPESGSVLFHSEREVWKAVEPHVAAGDARDDGRALRLMVAAGAGVPEHYLGEGGTVNRATAAEMGLPAIKRMQRRQEHFRQVLLTICRRVVDEAARAGRIGPRTSREMAVHFEELSPSAVDAQAAASKAFAEALALAEERGWTDAAQARRLWWRFVGEGQEGM